MESIIGAIIYYIIPLSIVFLGIFLDKYGYLKPIGSNPIYYWIFLLILVIYYMITLLISYSKGNPDDNEGDKYLPNYL